MLLALSALTGLMVGSFLNVVVHRVPRGESLVTPGSRCPGCATHIRPYDNVPVLSWLLLRGRCRSCGSGISVRYPLVELGTAALATLVLLVHGPGRAVVLPLALVALLVPAALIDLDERIIPNKLTALGAVAAIGLGLAVDPGGEPGRLVAGAAAGGFLLLAALLHPGGMGMGDVKLAGVLGLFLGPEVTVALAVAFLSGTVVGLVVIARLGAAAGRKTAVPFGPFLALGGVVAALAGEPVVHWYLASFT